MDSVNRVNRREDARETSIYGGSSLPLSGLLEDKKTADRRFEPRRSASSLPSPWAVENGRGKNPATHISEKMKKKARKTRLSEWSNSEPLKNLSDCDAAPNLRFFLVRNEEAEGSNPFSSTKIQKTYVGRLKKARLNPRYATCCSINPSWCAGILCARRQDGIEKVGEG